MTFSDPPFARSQTVKAARSAPRSGLALISEDEHIDWKRGERGCAFYYVIPPADGESGEVQKEERLLGLGLEIAGTPSSASISSIVG